MPIADYGLIGDTRTAALVAPSGSIDWCCLPRFDTDPVFARLIGGADAGSFTIRPHGPAELIERRYRDHSPVLETTWAAAGGTVTLADGMIADVRGRFLPENVLVRTITVRGAPVSIAIELDLGKPTGSTSYAGWTIRRHNAGVVCARGTLALGITIEQGSLVPGERSIVAVAPGQPFSVVIAATKNAPAYFVPPALARATLAGDERQWQDWADTCTLSDGPLRESTLRSLVTLRLLTYTPSGAPVAAPTTSLPEHIGGSQNWDYRYAWPRDGAITAVSLLKVGKADEANTFLRWLERSLTRRPVDVPALSSLTGGRLPAERTRAEWPGYAGSVPVRIGNAAQSQLQLDNYGWVLDAAHQLDDSSMLTAGAWKMMAALADRIGSVWRSRDCGIWEVRSAPKDFVHSKVMAWLALDRALRLAERHPTDPSRQARWWREREAIRSDVHAKGFDPGRGVYLREYGALALDASLLVLPSIRFEAIDELAVERTVRAIQHELDAGAGLLYRYLPDTNGDGASEGAFVACSFWLAQALARLGHRDEAQDLVRAMRDRAPLGLFSEQIDPQSGNFLGNFPQALSQAALVQAALALER